MSSRPSSPLGQPLMLAVARLSRSVRGLLFQLGGATALAVALPSWPLTLDPGGPLTIALALAVALLVDALVAPRYLADQRDAWQSEPTRPATSWRRAAMRALATLVMAAWLRFVFVAAGAVPGLLLAIGARVLNAPGLRLAAPGVGAIGVAGAFALVSLATSLGSRAAVLDQLDPWPALSRSLEIARRRWPTLVLAQVLAIGSTFALVSAPRIAPLFLLAVALRWLHDLTLSAVYVRSTEPASTGAPGTRHRRPAFSPAIAAVVIGLAGLGRSDVVSAQVSLIQPVGAASGAPAARLLEGQSNVLPADKPVELSADVATRIAFIDANNRLADAEEAKLAVMDRIALVRKQAGTTGVTPELTRELRLLRQQNTEARALVSKRRDELYKIGDQILAKAYGGEYGSLQRNWLDMKNTPSFLLGMLESTPRGIASTFQGAKDLLSWGYDRITGAPSEPVAPRDPEAERAARLLEREEMLETELLRIRDGATINRIEGNWYGEHVIGPVVTGEGAILVGKGALAVRAAVVARRTEVATNAATAKALIETERAVALKAAQEQAIAGLPRVEGELVGSTSLGQGAQYLPFRMADGRNALLYRGMPTEFRDGRLAIDAMNRAQPGLMPEIYGVTRLANGEPALVLERFDSARVMMNAPREPFLEPLRSVFTPSAYQEFNTFGGFGRALDKDYVFLDPSGRARLALPRRASQFKDLVESGTIFQNTTPRLVPGAP